MTMFTIRIPGAIAEYLSGTHLISTGEAADGSEKKILAAWNEAKTVKHGRNAYSVVLTGGRTVMDWVKDYARGPLEIEGEWSAAEIKGAKETLDRIAKAKPVEPEIVEPQNTPEWRTLKGIPSGEVRFIVYGARQTYSNGSPYIAPGRDRKQISGEPHMVTRIERDFSHVTGYTEDGAKIDFGGTATKVWVIANPAADEDRQEEAPEAPQEAPAEPTGPEGGKPVYHVRTGALVGWLTRKEFIPAGKIVFLAA